jgi:tRNA-specific adenosine deaminase 1
VFAVYERLPRKGKPAETEWAVLAAIVARTPPSPEVVVVALATGNKCAGGGYRARNTDGDVLFDSHAEVLARRAFRRFLVSESAVVCTTGGQSNFVERTAAVCAAAVAGGGQSPHTLRIRPGVEFVLFISQTPCGDASMFVQPSAKVEVEEAPPEPKRPRMAGGAKRLVEADGGLERIPIWEEEEKEGNGCDGVGACRVKPGKGDPTASMSCSDKIALWSCVGLQGSLLSRIFVEPVVLSGIVVCALPGSDGAAEEKAL